MNGKVLNIVSGAASGALNIAMTIAQDLAEIYDSQVILRKYNRAGVKDALVIKDRLVLDYIWNLIQVLRRENPDLVLVHGYSTHLWTKLAAAVVKKPVIHVEHNVEKYTWFRRKILQWTDPYTNAYICVSRGVAEHLKRQGADPKKITVIYNGIHIDQFTAVEKVAHESFTVGMTARFSSQKDQLTLIRAVEYLIKEKHADIRLILQGSGKHKKQCMKYVKDRALSGHIFFETGRLADLAKKIDLFVLSTNYEGLPLVLAEAMAAGLPVIGSDVPGVDEVIDDGVNGYLVPRGDWRSLADKMEEWRKSEDAASKSQLIARGLHTVKERFNMERMCRQYRESVAKIMEENGRI